MILCVAGNPAVDKLFEVEGLAPGEIHRPLAFVQRAGARAGGRRDHGGLASSLA
jgi:hypothetical protein